MPTLLRLVLGALLVGYTTAAVAVTALLAGDVDADQVRFALWTVALTAVALPALLGGLYLSYWTWTGPEARRRLRRLLLAFVLVQVLGAVGMLAAAAPVPTWMLGTAVLVVVGAVLDPAMAAIGRAARRIEERAPVQESRVAPELEREIRTGWRRGGVGAAIGLGVGLLLLSGLGLLLEPDESLVSAQTVSLIASFALLGAALGMLTKSLSLSHMIRDELRGDFGTARRIGKVVTGKAEPLDAGEERAAARYAAIARRWQPYQLSASLVLLLAIAVQQVGSLLADDDLQVVRWISLGILVVGVVVTVPLTVVRMRRLKAYADAHPVTA